MEDDLKQEVQPEQALKYFEDDNPALAPIVSNIKNGQCVAVLGPLFGTSALKKSVHDEIQESILKKYPFLKFDDEFQNLYVIEESNKIGASVTMIEEKIASSYDDFKEKYKNDDSYKTTYDNIAKINFSAFINFTQDTFLLEAFERQKIKHQFSYFSICDTQSEYEKITADPLQQKDPLIYNLFGHYQHRESLILNYERYYKFLFSMLGEKEVKAELVHKLTKARVFLLIGFDLKKWYVPIFINKLCKIGRERSNDDPMVIATLDNTDEENIPYVKMLKRFIPELNYIKNTEFLINTLLQETYSARVVPPSIYLSEEEKQVFLGRLSDTRNDAELLKLIEELKSAYDTKNNINGSKFMGGRKRELNELIFSVLEGVTTRDNHRVNVNALAERISDYITLQDAVPEY